MTSVYAKEFSGLIKTDVFASDDDYDVHHVVVLMIALTSLG